MSATALDTSGAKRLTARLKVIGNPDATPLMATWMKIIDDQNRKGVLAGTDKDGNPMIPVSYRPAKPGVKLTVEQRLGQTAKTGRGRYAAFGSAAELPNNNLKSSSYRKLDGPPLAPRRQFSRVITNLLTDFQDGRKHGQWMAWGWWDGVLSAKGVAFLHYHFTGAGRLPRRDLRGIRPEGLERARKALQAWSLDIVRSRG